MNSIPIIIPAYEPDNRMIDLIRHIRSDYDGDIIIVNDGSDASFDTLYEQAAEYGCTILRHDTNSGKGRALKTAFHYCLTRFPDLTGCITADSDGQHTAEDILRCMDTLQEHPDKLILGCRNFRGADVPRKSRFGNLMTCHACRLLCGLNISDTQTGLRGIPAPFMQELLSVRGERFEFETRMLIASKQRYDILEFPIQAVYDSKNNHQTHFDPLRDSLRIYRIFGEVFLRFFLSSVTSCVFDLLLFHMFTQLLVTKSAAYIAISTVFARIISSVYNYLINSRVVFRNGSHSAGAAVKYFSLAALQMFFSALFTTLGCRMLPEIPELLVKFTVDAVLFFLSYIIQRELIFRRK